MTRCCIMSGHITEGLRTFRRFECAQDFRGGRRMLKGRGGRRGLDGRRDWMEEETGWKGTGGSLGGQGRASYFRTQRRAGVR